MPIRNLSRFARNLAVAGSLFAFTISIAKQAAAYQAAAQQPSAPHEAQKPASSQTPQPAPTPLLNLQLVTFCKNRLGRTVGSGQCSALVEQGYVTVGARLLRKEFPAAGDYVWGTYICALEYRGGRQFLDVGDDGKKPDGKPGADVKPGDVIQLRNVTFRGSTPGGGTYVMMYPHHTSVIEKISNDGKTCTVLEQNVGDRQYVVETNLKLADLAAGWLRVYRPVARADRAAN